uniref:Uncharacterized protein n=1 Tax=Cacopsylla melanoneura TaxID=428564 RepID=A0A8D8LIP8_9HEMI
MFAPVGVRPEPQNPWIQVYQVTKLFSAAHHRHCIIIINYPSLLSLPSSTTLFQFLLRQLVRSQFGEHGLNFSKTLSFGLDNVEGSPDDADSAKYDAQEKV